MSDKPRRYVRLRYNKRFAKAWEYRCEFCGPGWTCGYSIDQVIPAAVEHARTCRAVAAAMERDQLRDELDLAYGIDQELERVQHHNDRLRAECERLRDICKAWQTEHTHIAKQRDKAQDELDRMRTDRDRLRDRLHQINPLSKDSNR